MKATQRTGGRQPGDEIARIARSKRGWGATLSRHWLWLVLLVLGIIATAILLAGWW